MKKEDLKKNKKQEWVTPHISRLQIEDTEGKFIQHTTEFTSFFTYAPS